MIGRWAENFRRQHWRQAECDQAGKGNSRCHGDGELREQPPDRPFNKGQRHKDRNQYHRGRNDGETHLPRAAIGGNERGLALLHAAIDVFEHHDRVVDDQSDGQHQRQQRQQIDREAEREQNQKGCNQRDRHGDGRHQRRPRAAQENVDREDDEADCDEERLVDFADRAFDEDAGVVAAADLHPLGQTRCKAVGLGLGRACHRQRIGLGLLDDADADHRYPVAAKEGPFFGRRALDPGDIAEPHQIPVATLAENELTEIILAAKAPLDTCGELTLHRFDAAGRQLDILRDQCLFDIAGGQAARRERCPVEPDSHRIAARTAQAHAGDTVLRREAVDEVAFDIVGQFQHRHAVADDIEPHDDVVARIGLLDVRRIGLDRQHVEYARHAIADVVGRRIDIAFRIELDGDARTPVRA